MLDELEVVYHKSFYNFCDCIVNNKIKMVDTKHDKLILVDDLIKNNVSTALIKKLSDIKYIVVKKFFLSEDKSAMMLYTDEMNIYKNPLNGEKLTKKQFFNHIHDVVIIDNIQNIRLEFEKINKQYYMMDTIHTDLDKSNLDIRDFTAAAMANIEITNPAFELMS